MEVESVDYWTTGQVPQEPRTLISNKLLLTFNVLPWLLAGKLGEHVLYKPFPCALNPFAIINHPKSLPSESVNPGTLGAPDT